MIAAIMGGIVGGLIINKIGLRNGLLYFGILQCLSTMLFSVQAIYGHNMPMFIFVVTVENFISGLATTALVAYISSLCNKLYTATQYALLSSVMSISRDIFSATSGIVAQFLGWKLFFVFSAIMSLPSILIIMIILKKSDCKIKK
jgi:PAT family beta-lactamase induction signal transducer AmpG